MAEKYSIFTEARSGVNPFYLAPSSPTLPLGALLLALRALPLLLTLLLLLPLEAAVTALEGAALPLGAALRQGLCRPLARCALFLAGLAPALQEVRKEALALRPPPSRSSPPQPPQQAGQLLLVNCCSYLDALVLLGALGAGMAQLRSTGALQRVPLWLALWRTFRQGAVEAEPPAAGAPPSAAPCSVLRALGGSGAAWAALALQPEGAPTNGTALLALRSPGLEQLAQALAQQQQQQQQGPLPAVRLAALHYSSSGDGGHFSPCFLGQHSPLYHAACLLTAPASACAVHTLPPGFDPLPSDFAAAERGAEWPRALVGAWEQLLRRWSVRGVERDAGTHRQFLAVAAGGKGRAKGE